MNTDIKKRAVEFLSFPVEKRRIFGGAGSASHEIVRVLNDGRPVRLSTVSERYALVQNADIIKPFIDTFGLESLSNWGAYNGGKSYHFSFDTGRTFNLGTEEKPDVIKERIIIRNSYDKTRSYSFMAGAFRYVCSNGLFTGRAIVAYKKIHVGNIPIQNMIDGVLENYKSNSFDLWRDFAKMPVTKEEGEELARNFKAFTEEEKRGEETRQNFQNVLLNRRISNRASRLISAPDSVDNARNLWGVFNQLNRAIHLEIARGQVDKKINGNKTAEAYIAGLLGK